jgi:hypothetical protein
MILAVKSPLLCVAGRVYVFEVGVGKRSPRYPAASRGRQMHGDHDLSHQSHVAVCSELSGKAAALYAMARR